MKRKSPLKKHAKRPSKAKLTWRKAWYFIWEDDSWASWFVNIVIAFVLIKFLIYPGLGWALSTSHPIVAVVSSSMEHDGSFDDWWASAAVCQKNTPCNQEIYYKSLGITQEEFKDFKFKNGFNKGDIMILMGTHPSKIKVGDVIVYQADRPDPIIHRVITAKDTDGLYSYATKGDHNVGSFYFESYIPQENYIGRAVLRIPILGYIKLAFVWLLQLIGIV
ncbi:signal peptidase I [Nanoarchaeota archaeon]